MPEPDDGSPASGAVIRGFEFYERNAAHPAGIGSARVFVVHILLYISFRPFFTVARVFAAPAPCAYRAICIHDSYHCVDLNYFLLYDPFPSSLPAQSSPRALALW